MPGRRGNGTGPARHDVIFQDKVFKEVTKLKPGC